MIIAITGPRARYPTLAEFEQARPFFEGTVVRGGEARGTDKAVAAWLRAREIARVEPFPVTSAEWREHGKKAGHMRNGVMLRGEPSLIPEIGPRVGKVSRLVAFPCGGAGTRNCIRQARDIGIPVTELERVDEPRIWNRHHGPAPCELGTADTIHRGKGRAIYVGRSSPLGNPWPLTLEPGQRRIDAAPAALTQYRRWLWARLDPKSQRSDPRLVAALDSIGVDDWLVCSCWPAHCHAEIVVSAWRWAKTRRPSP